RRPHAGRGPGGVEQRPPRAADAARGARREPRRLRAGRALRRGDALAAGRAGGRRDELLRVRAPGAGVARRARPRGRAGRAVGGAGEGAEVSAGELERWLAAARARVPYDNQLAQLNLIDSHDTTRLLTAVGGDPARMALAVTLLFTYPGVPCIYYGDEIGLEGGRDPDCRRCFDWDRAHWNAALHAHYRRLIGWRKARPELRRGA